jgi:diguanylate cyclase (GGDEF)-like protein
MSFELSAAVLLAAAVSLLAAGISTTVLFKTRRRLFESRLDREDLANSSLVIEEERRMLELVAKGASLSEVLDTLIRAIERISPGAICTVMLLDEERRRFLSIASGPSLPPDYLRALDGIEIGSEVGACGSAAFLNETVVVEDIATDHRFAGARDFVLSHGLRSCWSQPIRDSRGNVLGTFAMYHSHIARPRSEELRMARAAAQLAGNAIERIRAEKALSETADRLNLAEKVARFGIWEVDFAKEVMTISAGMAAIMERSGDKLQLPLVEFGEMVHPDDLAALRATADPANPPEGIIQDEFRMVLSGGTVRWMRSLWRFGGREGSPMRATGALIDITDEKNLLVRSQEARAAAEAATYVARQAEKLEHDRKAILELVAKDQPLDKIVATMASAVAAHLPGSLCSIRIELTDASHISVYPLLPERLAVALDRVAIADINATLLSEPIAKLSKDPGWLRFIDENGDDFPFQHYRAVPVLRDTRLTGLIISFLVGDRPDSTAEEQLLESWGQFASLAVERRGLYEQLSFRAQYDSLTTLLNRAALYDRLDAQISKSSPNGNNALAVVYLDLDRFKEINDRYGHAAGDKVLQHVSRHIIESVRHTDFAARIGGDEFIVILPGVSDRKEARRVADLVVKAIGQPGLFSGRELRVGASFGISIYPDDGAHTDTLLKMADEDMYRAKLLRRSFQPEQNGCLEADMISTPSPALLTA